MKFIIALIIPAFWLSALSGQEKFTDPRDGNVYATITLKGTTWMRENLRYSGIEGTFCFDNDTNNLRIYGALYVWEAAKAACPDGWHLPSGAEFRMLTETLENRESWGTAPGGFNIQLGGQQDYEGVFSEMDEGGYYWTSTEYDGSNAEYFSYLLIFGKQVIDISRESDIADVHGAEKSNHYSVRCVRN